MSLTTLKSYPFLILFSPIFFVIPYWIELLIHIVLVLCTLSSFQNSHLPHSSLLIFPIFKIKALSQILCSCGFNLYLNSTKVSKETIIFFMNYVSSIEI